MDGAVALDCPRLCSNSLWSVGLRHFFADQEIARGYIRRSQFSSHACDTQREGCGVVNNWVECRARVLIGRGLASLQVRNDKLPRRHGLLRWVALHFGTALRVTG